MENNDKIDRELARRVKKISDLREQISGLQKILHEEELVHNGQLDLLKLMNRPAPSPKTGTLRPNTELSKIHQMLAESVCPVHISDIARFLGKEDTPAIRASLAGSLGSYARDKRIFIKTAPNTFGLIEKNYTEESGDDDLIA